ncbi:hypothetical protein PSTU1396_19845 [Providencia stuartii]|nr:hypothetical protein PSTU1396_19845 [Providencia stuartii]CAK6618859.1 hypothetical protein PS9952019_19865 [Providencia stuartii]
MSLKSVICWPNTVCRFIAQRIIVGLLNMHRYSVKTQKISIYSSCLFLAALGEHSMPMGLVLGMSAMRIMSVLAQSPAPLQLLPSPKYNHGQP